MKKKNKENKYEPTHENGSQKEVKKGGKREKRKQKK